MEVLNEDCLSPFVLTCEHASNYLPEEYDGLGLRGSDLVEHIAWDIGAAELTRRLSERLNAAAFLGTYSRLLVDLNRPLESDTSIPRRSEATDIPGNLHLDERERQRRAKLIFEPFHERLAECLRKREAKRRRTMILAVHSFVPVFLGKPRPWHAGVLFGKAQGFAERLMSELRLDTKLIVGSNVPYSITDDGDYTVPVHGDMRRNPAVLLEIRHDLISHEQGLLEWTDRLVRAVVSMAD